jgi:hypothetical protein
VNPIIGAWVGLSAFGFLLSLFLTRESWLDMRALGLQLQWRFLPWHWGPHDYNGRRTAAVSRFWREFLRATVHAAYLAIGVPLLDVEATLSFFVAALMWGNAVLVTNSLIDARTRFLLYVTRNGENDLEGHP